jgi:tetratricopeptide (TPR) repeat protein/class 3 adenylate cyclase/TolB-like protein
MASLLTAMFTDVVESSATKRDVALGRDSSERDRAYLEKIQKRHFSLIRESCRAHNGREINTMGDAFFLTFDEPVAAVRCATDIQRRLAAEPIETPRGSLRVRIGIHSGYLEPFEGGFHGTDVDKAARVEAMATAQQILVSSTTYELTHDMTDVKFHRLGEFALKGVGHVGLWEADWNGSGPRPTAALPVAAQRVRTRIKLGAAAALILIAVSLATPSVRNIVFHRQAQTGTKLGAASIPSLDKGKYVAVLPFRVLGEESSLGYVGEGLQDALSAKLFQLQGAHLVSEDAVQKAGAHVPLDQIAREVGANLIVSGIVQDPPDSQIAIVAKLYDVRDGKLLWSQEFSGVLKDLLSLEDQIYSQLVGALGLDPSSQETARATQHPTNNFNAYDLYLKGHDAMRGRQNPRNVQAAINYYNQALQIDPGFALAYAGIADASLQMYKHKKDPFWILKALDAAQRAKQLNDKLPEVYLSLGSVLSATGKTEEAIGELEHALELAPNSDEVYRRLGQTYMDGGRMDKSILALKKAVQINPYYWYNCLLLGNAYFRSGDNGKALAAWQKVIELEPDNVWGYQNVGAVYLTEAKYSQSIPLLQKALQLQPSDEVYTDLGTAYFYLKRYNDAIKMYQKAAELNPNYELNIGNLADAYRWAGQKTKADAAYDQAISLAYKELEVNPHDTDALVSLASYYAKKGDIPQASQYIQQANAIDPHNLDLFYTEAVVENLAGHPDKALKALGEALRNGYSPDQIRNDPELESLERGPAFAKLISQYTAPPK